MNSAIILLSGGLDSVVSLAKLKNKYSRILALTFNYGQKSFLSEKIASEKISEFYSIEHKIIDLDWLSQISTSSLNTSEQVPNVSIDDLDVINTDINFSNSVWVPNRNGLFINIAACYADSYNYNSIIIGANKEESATFKDNSKEFVNAINLSLLNSTCSSVQVEAPLIDMTKEEIVKLGIDLNIPFKYIYSCYDDKLVHCKYCESCQRLIRALELNNRHDLIVEIFN